MERPEFVSIDVETTLNGDENVGKAHPMHPDNRIVLFGMQRGLLPLVSSKSDMFALDLSKIITAKTGTIFCGHNLSFDLLYLYGEDFAFKQYFQACKIWDTQLAEYILTGQRCKFSSLDELSLKYGLPVKDDKIKKYFEAGIGSDKIPSGELVPYLEQDLSNTLIIAEKQWDFAEAQGQLRLIYSQMEALHATTEMMFNGLHIDKKVLADYTVEVVNSFVKSKLDLEDMKCVEDIGSPKQWSQFFFGGKKKVKMKELVGLYKNGKNKYKLVEKDVVILPRITYTPDSDKIGKTGQVSVDDTVLKEILDNTASTDVKTVVNGLLKYRELSKQLSTYVTGLSNHIIDQGPGKPAFIHGKLNHTATVTGRLSSTSPNLQNISNNPIKQIFTSRFENGYLVEMDFNQLEVAALAHVTGDGNLIKDISSGTDIHSILYKDMFGRMPTKEERKPFKARTFQLIYGAGPKAISKQAGCSLEEAKKFVDTFYRRYPGVGMWHEGFAIMVDRDARHLHDREEMLEKFRTYMYQSETGRRYMFSEYYNEETWSSKMYSFSPTELKNYPIQGLATGDIVPMMLGVIFRKLIGRDDVKMVNTIHDSILFDVKEESIVDFILDIQEVLLETHTYFEKTFKAPLALKLKAGASYGRNWFNMEEVT